MVAAPSFAPAPRAPSSLRACCRPGAPQLDPDLLLSGAFQELGPHELAMYKPRWGGFFGTDLDDLLRQRGVTTLVVVGCNFPNCPRTTVYEASERDYRVALVEDAVSGLYDRGRGEMLNIGRSRLHRVTTQTAGRRPGPAPRRAALLSRAAG